MTDISRTHLPAGSARLACSPEQRLDRAFLERWRWSHLIMDEAHALKNRNASRTTRLRRVSNASRRRIMMTGAPRMLVCSFGMPAHCVKNNTAKRSV
jgi:SNF2 family DNA or RNA helicase